MSSREHARRFHFIREIASGGFGSVFLTKVMHADGFSRLVAVKLLKSQWSDNEEVARRMRDEARLLGLLRHRNIVDVMDMTSIDGRAAVVMEYLEAVDLRTMVMELERTDERMPVKAALEVGAAVASALDAAYNRPPIPGEKPLRVIHRDIKPSNIMIDDTGLVKVLDFGVARSDLANRESHTQELQFGSVDYMAPERLFFEPETPASDVYSLGASLFEILAREPFGKAQGRPEKHIAYVSDRLSFLRAGLSLTGAAGAELEKLLRLSLAFNHEDRPSSAEFFQRARALSRLMDDEDLGSWSERAVPPLLRAQQAAAEHDNPLHDQTLREDTRAFSAAVELPNGAGLGDALRHGALAELEDSDAFLPGAGASLGAPEPSPVDEWDDGPTNAGRGVRVARPDLGREPARADSAQAQRPPARIVPVVAIAKGGSVEPEAKVERARAERPSAPAAAPRIALVSEGRAEDEPPTRSARGGSAPNTRASAAPAVEPAAPSPAAPSPVAPSPAAEAPSTPIFPAIAASARPDRAPAAPEPSIGPATGAPGGRSASAAPIPAPFHEAEDRTVRLAGPASASAADGLARGPVHTGPLAPLPSPPGIAPVVLQPLAPRTADPSVGASREGEGPVATPVMVSMGDFTSDPLGDVDLEPSTLGPATLGPATLGPATGAPREAVVPPAPAVGRPAAPVPSPDRAFDRTDVPSTTVAVAAPAAAEPSPRASAWVAFEEDDSPTQMVPVDGGDALFEGAGRSPEDTQVDAPAAAAWAPPPQAEAGTRLSEAEHTEDPATEHAVVAEPVAAAAPAPAARPAKAPMAMGVKLAIGGVLGCGGLVVLVAVLGVVFTMVRGAGLPDIGGLAGAVGDPADEAEAPRAGNDAAALAEDEPSEPSEPAEPSAPSEPAAPSEPSAPSEAPAPEAAAASSGVARFTVDGSAPFAGDVKNIEVVCEDKRSNKGATQAEIDPSGAGTCTVTVRLNDRSRKVAKVNDPSVGTYVCFAAGEAACRLN